MITWAMNQPWTNVTTLDRRCLESYLSVCLLGTLKFYSLFYLVYYSPNIWLFIARLFMSLIYNLIDSVYNC